MARDKFDITLNIAGQVLKMNVGMAEEALWRQAASDANEVWRKLTSNFRDETMLHVMARVALLFAHGYLKEKEANGNVDRLLVELEDEFGRLLTTPGQASQA